MISTYQRLKRQRDAGEINGFTLIELLIVIVVLGILAAVVIFALGGITGKSAVAACQADGATISTALAAFNAQNAGTTATSGRLVSGTQNSSGPYIQSWPSNFPHYEFKISTASTPSPATKAGQLMVNVTPAGNVDGTSFVLYTGPTVCNGVK